MFVLLFDENTSRHIASGLSRAGARFVAHRVGDGRSPAVGSSDEQLLAFAEQQGAFIVTHDRRTMVAHLRHHLEGGGSRAGVFVVRPRTHLGRIVADLAYILAASSPDELRGTATFLPL